MKHYSEAILRDLDVRAGFIIDDHNLTSIRYAYGTVLKTNTEGELQEFITELVNKIKKKYQSKL